MKNSKIEWTDHTFNFWEGCSKVSPGCANCYAWQRNKRFHAGKNWGKGAPRLLRSARYRKQPLKWNREAQDIWVCDCGFRENWVSTPIPCPKCKTGTPTRWRPRVFCASLADWLDDEVPIEWLADLLKLIHDTPNLDWLLLTKRPENWRDRIAAAMVHLDKDVPRATPEEETDILAMVGRVSVEEFQAKTKHLKRTPVSLWLGAWLGGKAPANIWIGATVEDQQRADERIPALLKIPARVRFLSCEPLLEKVDLDFGIDGHNYIHWVICGGESGPGARPMHPDWARSLRDQCQAASVPFFFKQWGDWAFVGETLHAQRLGKKAAGRLLDGREWNEVPG